MKLKYYSPRISIELLEKQDVLTFSAPPETKSFYAPPVQQIDGVDD